MTSEHTEFASQRIKKYVEKHIIRNYLFFEGQLIKYKAQNDHNATFKERNVQIVLHEIG